MKKVLLILIVFTGLLVSCNYDSQTEEKNELSQRSSDYTLKYSGLVDNIDYEQLLKDEPGANIELLHEIMVDLTVNGDEADAELRYVKCKTTKSSEGITTNTTVYDFGFAWCLNKKTQTTYFYPCPGMINNPCQGILAPGMEGVSQFSLGCNC